MNKIKPSIILFVLAGILYLFSVLTSSENLELLTKPIIIPSIFVYCFLESKGKLNPWYLIPLSAFFLKDMLYLINFEDYFYTALFFCLLGHLVILIFLLKDFLSLLKRKKIHKSDLSFLIILIFLVYLMISILNVLDFKSNKEFVYYFLFGVELVLLGVFATLLFINENSRSSFYLLCTVSLFIVADVFFGLNINLIPLLIFKIGNIIAEIISYYFFTLFFIQKQKELYVNY